MGRKIASIFQLKNHQLLYTPVLFYELQLEEPSNTRFTHTFYKARAISFHDGFLSDLLR